MAYEGGSWIRYFKNAKDEELIYFHTAKVADGTIDPSSPIGNALITVMKARGLPLAESTDTEENESKPKPGLDKTTTSGV